MFQVIISSTARKSVKRLPEHYKKRTIELLLIFRENPIPTDQYDIKKLKGYTDTYRARIGDIRIIYEITWNLKTVHVLLIERREQAYT
ncbi:MAG TPA: type II toxin-antitoxin system RelE/ParE family toxin [Candidatus Bathyarchaeia archaeon]|nr:type II toxin-antitoxin system RelE/ParE family toxin [Candidatus Bathyarchaeia archaeon]